MGGLLRLLVGVGLALQAEAVQRIHSLVDTPSSGKYLEVVASLARLPGPKGEGNAPLCSSHPTSGTGQPLLPGLLQHQE
jgi:hypothetical protein